MKDDLFRFSLSDFLAYLFPGAVTLLAVAALIRLTRFEYLLFQLQLNVVVGILLVGCAYFVGVTISSLMVSLEDSILRYFKLSDPTSKIKLAGFEKDVMAAFSDIFGDHGPWSSEHFYLTRTLVCERMPACAITIERQASLRQMRRNSILPVLSLGVAGIVTGIELLSSRRMSWWFASLVITVSLLGSYFVARSLIKNGMHRNRQREVREVCCGLLSYFKSEEITVSPPSRNRRKS